MIEPLFNIYAPIYGLPMDSIPVFDRSMNIRQRAGATTYATYTNYASAYVQDELGFLNNNLRVSLGLRFTYAETVGKTKTADIKDQVWSPRVGVSYSIDKSTSVYAMYDQSFVPVAGVDSFGNAFKPIKGNDLEAGVKREWFGGRWVSSVSVYKIKRENSLVSIPTAASDGVIYSEQLGETESKGVEIDINGEVVKGLNLILNYAYTDSKITKEARETAPEKTTIGNQTPNTNRHTTNAWLSYRFSKGVLNGFGINGGAQWLAGRFIGTTKTPNMPEYLRFDGGVSYQKGKFGINMLVNNLLDNRALLTAASLPTSTAITSFYSYIVEPRRNMRMTVTYKL
jgi:iron complex outermembrane receptor protein